MSYDERSAETQIHVKLSKKRRMGKKTTADRIISVK